MIGAPPSWWARPIGWFLAHVVWRTSVAGRENVPVAGPVILVANHTGFVDGPLVFGVAPRAVHLLVKASMFRGVLGPILRRSGQIPVDSNTSRAALSAALEVLRRGDVVGLFPEGRRGRGDVAQLRAGAAWLAVTSGATVVPVAVLGTRRTGQRLGAIPGARRRLAVEFGSPLSLARPAGMTGRAALADANERIRVAISDVVATAVGRTGIALPADDPGAAPGAGTAGT